MKGLRKVVNSCVIALQKHTAPVPNRLTISTILALIFIWSVGTHVHAQSNEPSFDLFPVLADDDPLLDTRIPSTAGVSVNQQRHVSPNIDAINALFDMPILELLSADGFTTSLFDGKSYSLKVERRTEVSATSTEVVGRLDGVENGSFNLIRHISGRLVATFTVDGQLFRLIPLPDDGYALIDIDESGYPNGAEPVPVTSPEDDTSGAIEENDGSALVEADDGSMLDVMVVYTSAAKAQVPGGTTADIENLIGLAISEANTGYSDSDIQFELNLVHTQEISYVESADNMADDLFALRDTTDGAMDSVHALRDTHGADVVALIRSSGGGACGIAFLMRNLSNSFATSAFSVTAQSCAVGNYSFAHEIGHNLGSHHDRFVAGPPTIFPSSFGYTNSGSSSSSSWRTIMAYSSACANGCARINRWSNAQQTYNGDPLGVVSTDPAAADNALSINLSKLTASNWRTTVAGTPAITSPDNGSLVSATETFSWGSNGVPVDDWQLTIGTTLGANDIYDSGILDSTVTSKSVNQIPQTGDLIYARLSYRVSGGDWLFIDATYETNESTVEVPGQATLVAPNGVSSTTTPTYEWNAVAGATDYYLWVNDSSGTPIQETYTANAVGCADGTGICSINPAIDITGIGVWWIQASNSAGDGPWSSPMRFTLQSSIPVITTPTAGQTLTDPNGSETFEWSGSSGFTYWLYIGSSQGGKQYHDSGDLGEETSEAVTVPTNGSTIWARLWYRPGTAGPWSFIDEQFVAVSGNGPSLDAPAPGSVLSGTAETFSWSDTGGKVTEWWLYAGSTVGGKDYEDSGTLGTETSYTTANNNLPTGSVPVYVRLWYLQNNLGWQYIDETYISSP